MVDLFKQEIKKYTFHISIFFVSSIEFIRGKKNGMEIEMRIENRNIGDQGNFYNKISNFLNMKIIIVRKS